MKFSEFESTLNLLEKIKVDNGSLVFDYKDKGKGVSKTSIGTSFGKSKLKPYAKSDSILNGKTVFSVYQSSGATEIMAALKGKNDINVDSEDYVHFINRTAIYLYKVLQDKKIDIIMSPKSSSPLVDDLLDAVKERLPHIITYKAVFEKIPKEAIKDVYMEDDPRVTDKIRKSFEAIKKAAIKKGYFAMVKIDPPFRRFVRGFFQEIDPKIVAKCEDKNVALLDDVIASGTTISEMMRMIGAAGAKDVMGITIFKS
jgi:phosphoribosylpyrophosphate synthetase